MGSVGRDVAEKFINLYYLVEINISLCNQLKQIEKV